MKIGEWGGLGSAIFILGSGMVGSPVQAQTLTEKSSSEASVKSDEGGVQEIVVSAQRRDQNLQDVPISVTALSNDTLDSLNIGSAMGLQLATPGLTLASTGPFPQPFLRGVGNDRSANSEASVATYLDGVYLAYSSAAMQDLYDVERVEVLRGPQGTLFGRNSTGGAVNIVTLRPSREFGGKIDVGAGNFHLFRGKAYVTGPLSDTLAFSVSGSVRQRDSYNNNISPRKDPGFDEKEKGVFVRSKLLWEPAANFEAELAVDYNHLISFDAQGYRQLDPNALAIGLGGITGSKPFDVAFDRQVGMELKQPGGSLRMKLDLDAFSIVSISGYRDTKQYLRNELGGTDVRNLRIDIDTRSKQFSQELQLLSGEGSPIDWILGAYYFTDNQSNLPYNVQVVRPIGGNAVTVAQTSTNIRQITDSYSLFGQTTVPVTSTLSLTGGLRYTWETRTVRDFTITDLLATPNSTVMFSGKKKSFNKLTYRAGIQFQPTNDASFYASYTRGFKAGIFNLSSPSTDLGPVEPEVLDSYEIGTKLDLLDRKVRLNISAFHYDTRNLQVTIIAPGTGTVALRNAASARMNGAEVELSARPTQRLTVQASVSLLDAKYKSFPGFPKSVPSMSPFAPRGSVSTDLSGEKMMRSPGFTAFLNANYAVPVGSDGEVRFGSTFYHNSGYKFDPAGVSNQGDYNTLSASVTYSNLSSGWDVTAWMDNLTDERYYNNIIVSSYGLAADYAAPRTFGLNFKYHF